MPPRHPVLREVEESCFPARMETPAPSRSPAPHLFIAGTGRAGTSFLVRLLDGLGLETHLARSGEAGWSAEANAGFEDLPMPGHADRLPYVVKSPWLHQVIEAVLDDPQIRVEGVIVPIRRLEDAAASRVTLERQAMHRQAPWMAALARGWTSWGTTPGGMVHALEPLDQQRVLAVGLHRLLQALVAADVPVVLLDFPRLTTDAGYVAAKLGPLLGERASPARVAAAHAAVARPGLVRTEAERAAGGSLEEAALKRELGVQRAELAALRATLAAARAEAAALRASRSWRLTAPLRALAGLLRRPGAG